LVCDNLAFHGETQLSRRHTTHVFRDLPSLIYRMLESVAAMKSRLAEEIERMKATSLVQSQAHDLMVRAIRGGALPASQLPRVIEFYEDLDNSDFAPSTAWSLFNAFTEVHKGAPPRAQMEGSLRLSSLFRRELQLA
jgi:hypothetical protein